MRATSEQQFEAAEQQPGIWFPPPYRIPGNASSVKLAASMVAATGTCRLYGFTVTNTNDAAQFALCFDANSLPADAAVPLFGISVPTGDAKGVYFGSVGRTFDHGIIICNSSTLGSKTIGAADCLFDVQFVY